MSMYVRVSNEDGTYTEKKVYSKEDMIDLLHFVRLCAPNMILPDDELVKLWEEQK